MSIAIKADPQGYLIYGAMAGYLLGAVLSLLRRSKAAMLLFFVGFVVACTAYGYRWQHVRHVPMQNLFEVFLTLGVVAYPLSVFCRRWLDVRAEATDMLIGFVVLLPAGFIFNAEPQRLPPALQCWLFAPHVAVYMLSYMLMAKAAVQGAFQLVQPSLGGAEQYEEATYKMIRLGFPLLTVGLILGSWWGKLAWGDYWGWDPKELWSLASWLVYLGYLHFRYMFGRRHPSANSLWAITGMAVIVITLLWVNLANIFKGLHSYAT